MREFLCCLIAMQIVCAPVMGQCYSSGYRSRVSYSSYSYPTYSSYSYSTPSYSAPAYVEPVKVVKEVAYQAVIPVFQVEVRKYNTYGAIYLPPTPEPPSQLSSQQNPAAQNPVPPAQPNGQSSELRQVLDAVQGITKTLKDQDARIRDIEEYLRRAPVAPKVLPKESPKEAPKSKPKESDPDDGVKESTKLEIPDIHLVATKNCAMCHDHKMGEEAAGSAVSGPVIVTKNGKLVSMPDKHKTLTLVKLAKNRMCAGAAAKGLKPLTQGEYTSFVAALGKEDE